MSWASSSTQNGEGGCKCRNKECGGYLRFDGRFIAQRSKVRICAACSLAVCTGCKEPAKGAGLQGDLYRCDICDSKPN